MIIDEDSYLAHYGILRRSGRYPWGSGGNAERRSRSFLDYIKEMFNLGMTEAEIARGVSTPEEPWTSTDLRAARTIAKNQVKAADIAFAQRLKDKGYSNVAIGERMELNESSVRALLRPGEKEKADNLTAISNMLRSQVDEKGYIDIGSGVESQLGISKDKLAVAASMLREEGYPIHNNIRVPQVGSDNRTIMKVIAPPGTEWKEVAQNTDKIRQINEYSDDGGRSFLGIHAPESISSKRVDIRYAEDGGEDADGVIYVRPNVDDLSLGKSNYAQVRIAVDGTHFIKGMAVYKDDLPKGVDVQFNTNKSDTGNKLDALKPMKIDKATNKIDEENPFGSMISRQNGAMNIVNEAGDWEGWRKTLSSQVLSKQSEALARRQLALAYDSRREQLDEIMSLTNPAVKKVLLQSFADDADAAAVQLKAAAMPRQRTQVILPVNSLKKTEIYAPNFNDGENVVLIRYPHGGIFEIPELTVNNRNRDAKKLLGQAPDAVGINSEVAKKLSGADFDGDTVLVIPNGGKTKFKTSPSLEGLKNFDPQRAYPAYEGMTKIKKATKETQMGEVSNLVTDMTIRGATQSEIARAVRHSMVVIDAEKHNLNYKQSAIDNGIAQLKAKYQTPYKDTDRPGASTLISRATSSVDVPRRIERPMSRGGPIDPVTGKKVYENTGETYTDAKGRTVIRTTKSTKLAETDDAHTLSSGNEIEKVYADHSNGLKSMANEARRAMLNTKPQPYSPSAAKVYDKEVKSLTSKLKIAERNRPLERQAQILAKTTISARKASNPDMDKPELNKLQRQALTEARRRTGAKSRKERNIEITDREWEAIQAGAITNNRLTNILANSNLDRVKEKAMPKQKVMMSSTKIKRAQALLSSDLTQAEVANILGVSVSTLKRGLQ